jgi:hypothetical protein
MDRKETEEDYAVNGLLELSACARVFANFLGYRQCDSGDMA